MKLHTKIKALRAASNALLAVSMMCLAADSSIVYTFIFCAGWDWRDPIHTGLPWLVPICILTALTLASFAASDRLAQRARAAEYRAEFQAAQRRAEWRRGA